MEKYYNLYSHENKFENPDAVSPIPDSRLPRYHNPLDGDPFGLATHFRVSISVKHSILSCVV